MAEESSNAMNLDLNLGHSSEPGLIPESVPDDDGWTIHQFVRDAANRARWRWRQVTPLPHQNNSMELNELMVNSSLQAGEGSTAAEDRSNDVAKTCENNTCFLKDRDSDKKKTAAESENGGGDEGSFFDCSICLDLARDPVVTCCGHLFCWPCLYRWLHLHPHLKECPVCKGEVTMNNVTPIYGRGNNTHVVPEEDSGLEIPLRPHAHRVESLRHLPMQEIIRGLRSRFDLRDFIPQQDDESSPEGTTSFLTTSVIDRLLSRAMSVREQNPVQPPEAAVELAQSGGEGGSHHFLSLVRRLDLVAPTVERQNLIQPPNVAVDAQSGGEGGSHRLLRVHRVTSTVERQNPIHLPHVAVELAQSGGEDGSQNFMPLVRSLHLVAPTVERQNPIQPPNVALEAQSGDEGGSHHLLRVYRVASSAERQTPIHPPHDAVDLSQSGGEGGSHRHVQLRRFHRLASTAERQNPIHPSEVAVDLSRSIGEDGRRHYRVRRLHRLAATAESLANAYLHNNHSLGRSQDQPPPVDARHSFSSIAAVINSESQVDTAMEIDSLVSHSTSASRALYLDTGNSRAARRRWLNPY